MWKLRFQCAKLWKMGSFQSDEKVFVENGTKWLIPVFSCGNDVFRAEHFEKWAMIRKFLWKMEQDG